MSPESACHNILPVPIHAAQTQVKTHPSPDKNAYHELGTEGRA